MTTKELYKAPEMEIEKFETEDVITDSDEGWTGTYPMQPLGLSDDDNGRAQS